MATVSYINPPGLYDPPGYTHVVEVSGGRTVYIAGQVATDAQGNLVGENDFRAQLKQVLENIGIALQSVGGDFPNIVKINIYVTDMSNIQAIRDVRDDYFDIENPPASTLVEVSKLANANYLLEIEAVAVLPS